MQSLLTYVAQLYMWELKTRFASSRLGFYWVFLHPLFLLFSYLLVFKVVMKIGLPGQFAGLSYGEFFICAMIPWTALSDTCREAVFLFSGPSGTLWKQTSMPLWALPLRSLLVAYSVVLVEFIAFFAFLGWTREIPASAWYLLLLLPVQMLLNWGLVVLVAVFSLLVKDFKELVLIGLHVLFFATPIIYPIEALPPIFVSWIKLNPFTSLIEAYKAVVLKGVEPGILFFLYVLPLSMGLCAIANSYIKRKRALILDFT